VPGRRGWRGLRGGTCRRRGWHRLPVTHDRHFVDPDWCRRLVLRVAIDPSHGRNDQDGVRVALPEDCIAAVQIRLRQLCNEELAGISVFTGVCHGQTSRYIEREAGCRFVVEVVARIARSVAAWIAALHHESGDDTVKGQAVVERPSVNQFARDRVIPVLGALSEADEVGGGQRRLLVEEFAGHAAHRCVEHNRGTSWNRCGSHTDWCSRSVRQCRVGILRCRGLRGERRRRLRAGAVLGRRCRDWLRNRV